MVYLVIKELSTIANDVIMVTSSLTKDINSRDDTIYRPNAIRALCKITDVRASVIGICFHCIMILRISLIFYISHHRLQCFNQ